MIGRISVDSLAFKRIINLIFDCLSKALLISKEVLLQDCFEFSILNQPFTWVMYEKLEDIIRDVRSYWVLYISDAKVDRLVNYVHPLIIAI